MDNFLVDKFCAQFGVTVVPIGKNKLRCACPFHEETIPSFTIYLDTSTYYCYGCGRFGYLDELVGAEPDLQLRLNHALAKSDIDIELGFALACSRVKDKTQVWDVMKRFDDEQDPPKKIKIFEEILEKDLI